MIRLSGIASCLGAVLLVGFLWSGVTGMANSINEKVSRPALWKQVGKAKEDGLPQTAVRLLDEIYRQAVAEEDFVDAVRALCVQLRVEGEINQPEQPYIIRKLQRKISDLPPQMKPVMQTILADWFMSYYENNRWRFAERSQTGQSPSEDFETWDLPRLLGEIDRLLSDGLSNADDLKQIPIARYESLLEKGDISDAHRPTLYDFLVHRAIAFYQLDEQITRKQDAFEVKADSPIFAARQEFLAWQPATTDTHSFVLKAVRLYQELLRFHANDEDSTALLDADLHRLALGNGQATGEQVAIRYRAALQRFADQNLKHELSSLALSQIAASLKSKKELVESHQIASVGLNRFPESLGGRLCYNLIQQIEAQAVTVRTEQVWNAAKPTLQVTYKNIEQVHFRLLPFDYRNWKWGQRGNPENLGSIERKALTKQKPAAAWSAGLPATQDYQQRTEAVDAKFDLPSGCYLLLASRRADFNVENNKNNMSISHVWISDLALVTRQKGQSVLEGQVLDAITGVPVADAQVTVHSWQYDGNNSREIAVGKTSTDASGVYRLATHKQSQHQVFIQYQDQVLGFADHVNRYGNRNSESMRTYFFTDRAIYRPGQTIQFKGICAGANTKEGRYEPVADQAVTVSLRDMNDQEVDRGNFTSNAFGSISGSFVAAKGRSSGPMTLRVESGPSGQANVRVEEYKRPKFYVDVEKPDQEVRLEQSVSVKVKATGYTGAASDGSKVVWRVERGVEYPDWWYWRCWWMPPSSGSQQIANGKGVTSTDGTFDIEFPATPDASVDRESQPVFVFTVTADVTDTAGETRSATQRVRVGYTSLAASVGVEDWLISVEPVSLKIQTKNLNDKPLAAAGKLTIYQLQGPDKVQRVSLGSNFDRADKSAGMSDIKAWPLGDSVQVVDVETDEEGESISEVNLPAGAYKAVFETTDNAGQAVLAEVPFLVRDLNSKQFAVKIPNDLTAAKWTVEPGEEWLGVWGTGYDTGRAYVEIEHRGEVVQAFWTDPQQTQTLIPFLVEEKHRGGFQVRVTYVRENRAYLSQRRVMVPWSNKDLKIKWEHFTSKLQPGGRETWTAVVTGPDAERRTVEMVAAMYDASLDAYAPHAWSNQIKNIFYQDYSRTSLQYRNQQQHFQTFVYNSVDVKGVGSEYRRFGHDVVYNPSMWHRGWSTGRGAGGGFGGGRMLRMSSAPMAMMSKSVRLESRMDVSEVAADGLLGFQEQAGEVDKADSGSADANLDQVAARTNLQETAFFYPSLTTDENGVVRIEFVIPEALTKWKFLGFAHDTQLRTALLTDEMTTSKDLMVQPNPPRFLREGDQLEFSAKLTNQSDKPVVGTVRLALTNAATDEAVDAAFGLNELEQSFEVPAGESKSVFWELNVPDFVGVLNYKVVAASDNLSDGEEGLLPVLSKRILITESLPLPIRGNQTKTFNFDRLDMINTSDSLKSQSLTVQMTSNPSWYAVMALPYLMEYPHQCNEQVFNRLYANALGRHIVTSSPRIKRVFDQWRGTEALDSPLEKNEDIRNVLIEESPWLRAAKDESKARRHVAVLFDENRLTSELQRATDQLTQAQYSDGSWSWFPGGPANDFITLYITTGFGRLRHLNVEVDAQPAIHSLGRLDGWIHSTWQRLKNDDRLDHDNLSSQICLYLYGRSFFLKDQGIADQHRVAVDYFLGQAKQYWAGMGRMSQAQLAIALKRFGDVETPAAIMDSLTERSLSDEEMGRFWRESEESWWWYRAPIETQAMLIEAYDEVLNDAEKVEDCKIWLLKQKQTQNWKTTKATADAVYSLLLRGTDSLASSKLVEVTLGPIKIEPTGVEAGTGFYEQKFAGSDVKAEMKTIKVAKSDDGIAWGSVHWQYLEDVSKIKPYEGTPLQLKKSLYIKQNTKEGPTINPVSGPVEVGDELVTRVELRVDRDMEYVHLKDQRGSGTEPVNVMSKYKSQDGLWYYESTRDTASHFFIDYLPRGTYVFEYSVRVQHRGEYQTGIASIESMYAPEFKSHSNSVAIKVE